jgi:hypothetical protein
VVVGTVEEGIWVSACAVPLLVGGLKVEVMRWQMGKGKDRPDRALVRRVMDSRYRSRTSMPRAADVTWAL